MLELKVLDQERILTQQHTQTSAQKAEDCDTERASAAPPAAVASAPGALTTEATSIATDASNAVPSGISMSVFDIVHVDTNLVDFNKIPGWLKPSV